MSEVSEVNERNGSLEKHKHKHKQIHQAAKENNNNKFVGQWRQSSGGGKPKAVTLDVTLALISTSEKP